LRANPFDVRRAELAVSLKLETLDVDSLDTHDQLFDLAFVGVLV
jgi:hypothetical protein